MAGIIAAETNNAVGIAGIAWGSMLMPVKVITASGEGAYSDLLDGIVYAADNGVRVLNLSIVTLIPMFKPFAYFATTCCYDRHGGGDL